MIINYSHGTDMDFSNAGLQKLFSTTFGRKWRATFNMSPTKQVDISDCEIQDISGGFFNRVYRLSLTVDHAHTSVIVKHAPPYIKCLGLERPLSDHRIHTEFLALRRYHQALPGSVPLAYFHDGETKCVVMEDLKGYDVMSLKMTQGCLDLSQARQLAEIVAKLHRDTHIKTSAPEDFQTLLVTFSNEEMVTLNSDLTFVGMVDPSNPTNMCSPELTGLARSIREDPGLLHSIRTLNAVFLKRKECLTHGDLHLGSVMVREPSAKVIDAEFAFMGPAGADIGVVLANYIFSHAAHSLYPKQDSPGFANRLREALRLTVEVYFDSARRYLNEEELALLVSHTAGFTGCHILKWMIGIAESRDLLGKPQAELTCLNIGVRLLREYQTLKTPMDLHQCISIN